MFNKLSIDLDKRFGSYLSHLQGNNAKVHIPQEANMFVVQPVPAGWKAQDRNKTSGLTIVKT